MASTMNIVLIGETGSGKSTFINYVTNFFLGGTPCRPRIAIPTRHFQSTENFPSRENAIKDNTQSKTISCQHYHFEAKGQSYLFIDTPGLSDTNGIRQDDANLENIFEEVQRLQDLTAMLLILNGAQARMTVNVKNAISRFQERLPNVIVKNVIVVLTNCQAHSVNFEPHVVGLPSSCTVLHMQNSAFSTHPNTWDALARKVIDKNWETSMSIIKNLLINLEQLTPVSTYAFHDMQEERNAIKSLLHSARVLISQLQQLEDEIAALERASHNYGEDSEKFRHFEDEREIPFREIIIVNHYNTICTRCTCVCHERCSLDETYTTGDKSLKTCAVMDGKKCTVCPGRCSYKDHCHDRKDIRQSTKKVKTVLNAIKNKFINADSNKRNCDSSRERYKEATAFIEQCIQTQYVHIETSCFKLNDMCMGFNVIEELVQTITFLQLDVEALKSDFAQKKGKAFIARLEELCRKLQQKCPPTASSPSSNAVSLFSSISQFVGTEDAEISQLMMPTPLVPPRKPLSVSASSFSSTATDNKHVPHALFRAPSLQQTSIDPSTATTTAAHPSPTLYSDEPTSPLRNWQSRASPSTPKGSRSLPKDWPEWSVEKLVDIFRNRPDINKDERTAIRKELLNRSRGKSVGYLSSDELYQLCKQVVIYHANSKEELDERQDHIKESIEDVLESDIANLDNISMKTLLELVAIRMTIKMRKDGL